MKLDEARELLAKHGQSHLLAFERSLSENSLSRLLSQISRMDFGAVDELRALLSENLSRGGPGLPSPAATGGIPGPAPVTELAGERRENAVRRGERELAAGRVAALMVAGGQGSRLGFDGPKGCFPVGPVSGESLFYFHARKILALGRKFGRAIPLYVMTSETNGDATREFFRERDFFGLAEKDVFFFTQAMWPALFPDGRMILERPDSVFLSPDGHGGVVSALRRSGAMKDMTARGIEFLFHFQVDNPMVEIASPAAVGFHANEGADATLVCCRRESPGEKAGFPVLDAGKVRIVEYSEISTDRVSQRNPDGSLVYGWASTSPYVFSLSLLESVPGAGLPVHLAHKKVPFAAESGETAVPAEPNAWKFERFVFDILEFSRKTVCLAVDRGMEYSPVKNADGAKSPATCRADLSRKWGRWLAAAGVPVPLDDAGYPRIAIEIDPAFANDPATLAARLSAPDAPPIASGNGILLR